LETKCDSSNDEKDGGEPSKSKVSDDDDDDDDDEEEKRTSSFDGGVAKVFVSAGSGFTKSVFYESTKAGLVCESMTYNM